MLHLKFHGVPPGGASPVKGSLNRETPVNPRKVTDIFRPDGLTTLTTASDVVPSA